MTKCECGCGQEIIVCKRHKRLGIPKFIRGHSARVNHPAKGKIPWNKGKKGVQQAWNKGLKGLRCGEENSFYGRRHSIETKLKISKANEGRLVGDKNPAKRLEVRKKISQNRGNYSGEKHWRWKGGISFEPYCHKFNNKLKKKIRERDNYQCQMPNCLYTQLENKLLYNDSLHVHHVHYDKPNCEPDLITLCSKCNAKVNTNRDYWEQILMNILMSKSTVIDAIMDGKEAPELNLLMNLVNHFNVDIDRANRETKYD